MIEKISLVLMDESKGVVPIEKTTDEQMEIKIEVATADMFSAICRVNNNLGDKEIQVAEKFRFALNLKEYLEDMKENANTSRN